MREGQVLWQKGDVGSKMYFQLSGRSFVYGQKRSEVVKAQERWIDEILPLKYHIGGNKGEMGGPDEILEGMEGMRREWVGVLNNWELGELNERLLEDYLIRKRGEGGSSSLGKGCIAVKTIDLLKTENNYLDIDIERAMKILRGVEKEETRIYFPQILSALYQGLMSVDD